MKGRLPKITRSLDPDMMEMLRILSYLGAPMPLLLLRILCALGSPERYLDLLEVSDSGRCVDLLVETLDNGGSNAFLLAVSSDYFCAGYNLICKKVARTRCSFTRF